MSSHGVDLPKLIRYYDCSMASGTSLYLLDRFDPTLFANKEKGAYFNFDMWEIPEETARNWLEVQRSRSIFSKNEIIDMFEPRGKIQMVQTDRIELEQFDRIIVWTPEGRYFAYELVGYFD